MKRLLFALLAVVCLAAPAHAQSVDSSAVDSTKRVAVLKAWGGVNAVWFDDQARPSDVEVGATAAASLYHPVSLVASAFEGLKNAYFVASVGPRISLSDSSRTQMSVGVSVERQFSNKVSFRPREWQGKVSVGFRPWPASPATVFGVQAAYGFDSNTLTYLAAVRYRIGG